MHERDEDSHRETPAVRAERIRRYQQSLTPEGEIPRRCSTNIVADFNGECLACGAANGEACLNPA